MASLPAEIVEQFICHLNEDPDRLKTLLSCSLVSQTWCAITRPFLYSRLALDFDENRTSLADVISASSHLRTYVHHLLITSAAPIVSALGDLPSLRSLQIRSSRGQSLTVNREFARNLWSLLSSRHLTSLELSDLDTFPARIFYHCLALQNLAIRHVTFEFPTSNSDQNEELVTSQLKERPVLKSLILSTQYREGSDTLHWLLGPLSPFDFSQLETFIGLDRCDLDRSYEAHCTFISHVAHSLKTVLIDPPTSSLTEDIQDPLGALEPKNLQKISSITVSVIQEPGDALSTLPFLIALLSGLPNPETLHEITLLCDLYEHAFRGFDFHSQGWKELDSLLLGFPNLKRVHLKCYDESDDQIAATLVSWFYDQLPRLVSRDILVIDYFPDLTYTKSMQQQLMG
ncbi:hypothetical protein BDN72DRAFT_850193 [Pluteus cervinus]|uniref:Uncharacterized protein n=1 Tax=Pluteus cervinus TaxID=181527 RepID=A0ACD3A580_9AGAR|nr:hypothetical protein BDN72DRAFT_850193 [Pluteus cervinus]